MKNRNFWYLFSAQAFSTLGDFFGLMAIEWVLYDLTGSKLAMGALGLAFGLSEIIVRFLGAPLIDRVNRLRLMALLDLIRFGSMGLLFLLGHFHLLQIWHIYVTAVIVGSCSALFSPSSMAVLPSVVGEKNLVRSLSIMDGSGTVSMLTGPILASLMIVYVGPFVSIGVDSLSFLISAILIYLLSNKQAGKEHVKSSPAVSNIRKYLRESLDGLNFYRFAPALLYIQLFVSIKNMCTVGAWSMIVPYGIEHLHVGAQGIGMLSTASSVGLVLGFFIVGLLGDIKKRRIFMLGSLLLQGCFLIVLGFIGELWLAMIVIAGLGVCGPFYSTISSSLYARMVPDRLRGRVMSARLLVGGSLQPVGSYGAGGIAQVLGVPVMFMIAGAITLISSTIGFMIPALRQIDSEVTEVQVVEHAAAPLFGDTVL